MTSSSKVFIGGLSWETTGEKLRAYFENYGVVREAFVSYNRNNGRPRGFGFVVFESPEVADKVVAGKHTIDRREVEAKKAVPKDDHDLQEGQQQQQPINASPSEGPVKSKKIFVGGLAPSVDENVLKAYFEEFGVVEDAVVMYDHDNKRPRGFGFVTFASEEAVELVFAKGAMQRIQDKQIEIKSAVPRDQMPATQMRPLNVLDPRFGVHRGHSNGVNNPFPYGGPVAAMHSQFGNMPRGYGGPRNMAPVVQQSGRGQVPYNGGMGMPRGFPQQASATDRSGQQGKAQPMPRGSFDPSLLYPSGLEADAAGSLANGSMFGASSQAALAYANLASLQHQAQAHLNGMQPVPGTGAAAGQKLNAADFGAANNLNLKALALARGFGAAFPGSQGNPAFADNNSGYQHQHTDEQYAEAAAANLNAAATVGLSVPPEYNYQDRSFAAAGPNWPN